MKEEKWAEIEEKYGNELKRLIRIRKITEHQFKSETIVFGCISDTHLGNICARKDLLKFAYEIFAQRKVEIVYHAGDIVDGEKVYRGQEYELYAHGLDAQVEDVVKNFPFKTGITTYFISGNHDLSFQKTAGCDIGERIAEKRNDLIYLGQEEQDVILRFGKISALMRLFHPAGGTAYAISYKVQKAVESYSGGRKPNILLLGHYHKAEFLPCLRNVLSIQCGTLCGQTPFMRRKSIAAHIGFWIIECQLGKNINRFKPEFFAYYEK
jgi:predicted phosphodiesterase